MPNSVFLSDGYPFSGQMVGPAANNTAAPPFSIAGDLTSGYASSAVGTLSLVTAGTTRLSLNSTAATFAAGVVGAFSRTALGTTSTDALSLTNSTAATSGTTVQISPRLRLRGTAWDTSASETVDFFIENLPATAATPTGTLKFGYSLNGAAASYPMTLSSAGALTTLNNIIATGSGASIGTGTHWKLSDSGTDGKPNLYNNAQTSGVGFDVTTDAVLKIRTTSQTNYATIDVLGIKASGAAGASFGPGAVTSITVVNGIVTAIS